MLAALHMHQARAAIAVHQTDTARSAAKALRALLQEGYVPDFTHTPEAWWVVGQALQANGENSAAHQAWAAGQQWVQARALPNVPASFLDSFLHRSPVNQKLLALAVS